MPIFKDPAGYGRKKRKRAGTVADRKKIKRAMVTAMVKKLKAAGKPVDRQAINIEVLGICKRRR